MAIAPGSALCPSCASPTPVDAKFCPECGRSLANRQAPPPEPERKYVTLLFADIRDSTQMVQDLDAEDSTARLRPAIEAMSQAVHRAGGTVYRNTGDGVLALFGAPQAVEDHAMRGCRAAILMHAGIAAIDSGLVLRIGIHTGEVITRLVPGDFGPTYEVGGTALHLGRRLEQAATPGKTLISEATWDHVRAGIVGVPRGEMSFKGFERPVATFEVEGYVPGSRWAARATRDLTLLVGRRDILATMNQRLSQAAGGHGQAVMIMGDPGVGKSRLMHQLLSSGVVNDWTVWQVDAQPLDAQSPFALVRTLLRTWLGAGEAVVGADRLENALEDRLAQLGLQDEKTATPLRALLDLPIQGGEWADLAQVQRRSRIVSAIGAVVAANCRAGPLLLVVEDAHWCDRESWQALQALLPGLDRLSMALLVTRRPDPPLDFPDLPNTTTLAVPELGIVAAGRMLEDLLGPDPSLVDVKLAILRAGRIPLYIEELVDHLARQKVIEGRRGDYKSLRPATSVDLPRSLQIMATARIDALPLQVRAAVLAASVIGRSVDPRLLADVAEMSGSEVVEVIAELVANGIFGSSLDPQTARYEFRHDVIRQAAYDGLLRERLRALHARVADGIERLYGERRGEWIAELAYHAEHAQDWERAYGFCREATEAAIGKAAYDAASAFCDRALAHLTHLPASADNTRRSIDLHLLGRAAVGPKLGAADWLRHAEEAERLAAAIADPGRQMLASIHRTWAASYMARPLDALVAGREALARAEAAGHPDTIVVARSACGQALYAHGDLRGAIRIFGEALDHLAGERRLRRLGTTVTTSISCLVGRSNSYAQLGAFVEADADAAEVAEIAEHTRLPLDGAFASYAVGFGQLHRMEFAAAERHLKDAVDRCRQGEYALPFSLFANSLGAVLSAQGRHDEAAEVLAEAIESAEQMSFIMARITAELNLGGVALARGNAALATQRAREGLEFARERGLLTAEVIALRLLAQCLCQQANPNVPAALDYLGQAIHISQRMEARPGEAATRALLASLLIKLGRKAPAAEQATTAARLFGDLGLTSAATRATALAAAAAA